MSTVTFVFKDRVALSNALLHLFFPAQLRPVDGFPLPPHSPVSYDVASCTATVTVTEEAVPALAQYPIIGRIDGQAPSNAKNNLVIMPSAA